MRNATSITPDQRAEFNARIGNDRFKYLGLVVDAPIQGRVTATHQKALVDALASTAPVTFQIIYDSEIDPYLFGARPMVALVDIGHNQWMLFQ